jgi:hypothetical protein
MSRIKFRSPAERPNLLDERGVALPLALFGLVAVTLLVSTALITSSTELSMSRAHQDAARSLYAADAALERFVGQRAAMVGATHQRLVNGTFAISLGSGQNYNVQVAEVFRSGVTDLPGGGMQRRETYSLLSQPASGSGRSVGAMVQALRTAGSVSLNIESGLTIGMNTTISGNATISDGSSGGAACDSASAAQAIRHSSNSTITYSGSAHEIVGNVQQDSRNAEELMNYVLNGRSLGELADMASIRFGPMYDRPAFNNGNGPKFDATDVAYRWGCPSKLMTGCPADQAERFPAVAIDAAGGTVEITGDHGQGMLIIRNGNVHIRGNFLYQGIIVAEGSLRVTGTPRLEGAVIAMGDQTVIEPGDSEFSSGNSLVRFNRCEIVNAQKGLTLQSLAITPQTIDTGTFAWYEVVR